jgi:hypothetical protein
MTSDYAKELGEVLDRLAELIPQKGPGSPRLDRMTPEDRQYVGRQGQGG